MGKLEATIGQVLFPWVALDTDPDRTSVLVVDVEGGCFGVGNQNGSRCKEYNELHGD